jgi:transcriptional repressor NrdR
LTRSLLISVRKRQIENDRIERIVNSIQRRLESLGENEIPTKVIGEMVMEVLAELDTVAYVRFASVYRNFREAKDFEEFVEGIGGDDT